MPKGCGLRLGYTSREAALLCNEGVAQFRTRHVAGETFQWRHDVSYGWNLALISKWG